MQELKELRKKKGMTQMDAAFFCHVSLSTWQLWERGINHPNGENANRLKELENLPDKK